MSTFSTSQKKNTLTIVKGGSIAFLGRLLFMIFGYLLSLLIARNLGAEAYGLFVLGFSIVNLTSAVALLGLNRGIVRYVAIYRGTHEEALELGAFWAALGIVTVSSIIGGLVVFFLVEVISKLLNAPPEFAHYVTGFALWIPVLSLIYLLATIPEAIQKIKFRTMFVDVGWPFSRVIFSGLVLLMGLGLAGVIWANVAASIVNLLLIGLVVYIIFLRGRLKIKVTFALREMLRFSIPVMLFSVMNLTQNQISFYFLAALSTTENVGIFHVASRTAVVSIAFLEGLGFIFSPIIADLTNRKEMSELQALLAAVTRWSFTLGLAVFALTLLLGQSLLSIFGEIFVTAISALLILSLAQFVNAATGPVGMVLTMSGRSGWNLFDSLLTLIVTIVFSWLLIPRFGVLGAAISGGLAISLVNILRVIQVYWFLNISAYDRQFFKPILAGIIAFSSTYIVINTVEIGIGLQTIVLGSLIFVPIYLACIFVFGLSEIDHYILQTIGQSVLGGLPRRGSL